MKSIEDTLSVVKHSFCVLSGTLIITCYTMSNNYWHIEGYNGLNKIYEKKVLLGCFTEGQIQNLLMALVAKAGLTFDEIVGAYAKRNTKISNQLLSIQKDGPHLKFSCGENPYFTARVVDDNL